MKASLTKDESGKVTGYSIEIESPDDIATIEQIRDMYFWEKVVYDGRESIDDDENTTVKLKFKRAAPAYWNV